MSFDIEKIKRKMLVKYPFFGSIIANIDYQENKQIKIAGTNGHIIYYNPDFLEKITIEEQTFIFAHEVCHIAFNHILRSEGKNERIWNIATDAVINAFLKNDGLKMPSTGVDMEDAINYDAEQLYEKLLQEEQLNQNKKNNQKNQQEQNSQQNQNNNKESQSSKENNNTSNNKQTEENQHSSSSSKANNQENQSVEGNDQDNIEEENNQDVGHDTHSMWKEAVKKHQEEQKKSNKKQSLLDKLLNKNKEEKKTEKSEIEKKQQEISEMGEKETFNKNKEEKKKELEELKKTLSRETMQAGTTSNREIRNITNIGQAKPLIDWRYILREAVKYDVDWSYRNAYIEDGVISATLEEQPIPETEILLDTSGSINEILLKNFLRECKNILLHSKLKVGCFDTEFYGFHDIRTEEDIENMKFEGGGGTNFNSAVNAFSRRVENKIIFTDGEANMPDKSIDAIWIVFGGRTIKPKGGRVINITEEQLEKLYSYVINSEYKRRSR